MENKSHKERINYVANPPDNNGDIVYTATSVNYGGPWEGRNEKEIASVARAFLEVEKHYIDVLLSLDEPFELKELTAEEWEAKDDNIDYWEIDRMKRVLQRPSIQEKWKKIIWEEVGDRYGDKEMAEVLANSIIDALINQENN